jgi:hypothetical protein
MMKSKRFHATPLVLLTADATMFNLGPGHAQTAADMARLWCIRITESLLRNYQALASMRAAGISRLRRALVGGDSEIWSSDTRTGAARSSSRQAIEAECRDIEIRPGPPGPGRADPYPAPGAKTERTKHLARSTLCFFLLSSRTATLVSAAPHAPANRASAGGRAR